MSFIKNTLGALPIIGKLIDPSRAERKAKQETKAKPAPSEQAIAQLHDDNIPDAKISNDYLTVGEAFTTAITLPEGVSVEGQENLQVIMESPILGPLDISKTGLAEMSESNSSEGWDKIEVASKTPMPASVKFKGVEVTTQAKFPVKILDQGKVIAKSRIEIGPNKLPKEQLDFIKTVTAELDAGKEFETKQFPEGTAKPLITVSYSNTPDSIGGKLLIKSYRGNSKPELSWHLTNNMNGDKTKWGGAAFKYSESGVKQKEDHIFGGRAGPSFNSASELARFVISNTFRKSIPHELQIAEKDSPKSESSDNLVLAA